MESPDVRRRTMQAVKSKNTAPELLVRSLTHQMGLPVPAAPQRSSGQTGPGVSRKAQDDFCARLLLART